MKIIDFKNKKYPFFQTEGNASQFSIPYAKHFCQGVGYDIGCNKKEWSFPGSIPIDINFNDGFDAYKLPSEEFSMDYIYSSHCLEHLVDWVNALDYWITQLKIGGILFLYLPDYSQEYWRPWNNRKHIHIFTPQILEDYMIDRNFKNIFYSERDMNNSFMIVGQKN
jgi:predicted SAM-dependent methyltransferase